MQLIQKVAGRPGATVHAPAPVHHQAPWYSQQSEGASQQTYSQAVGGPAQQYQHGNHQTQGQDYPQQAHQQASEPAQQGCGNFVKSLLSAFFGK